MGENVAGPIRSFDFIAFQLRRTGLLKERSDALAGSLPYLIRVATCWHRHPVGLLRSQRRPEPSGTLSAAKRYVIR